MSIRVLLFNDDGSKPCLKQLDGYFDHQMPHVVITNKDDWIKIEGELQPLVSARYETRTPISPVLGPDILHVDPTLGFASIMYRNVPIIHVEYDDESYVGSFLNGQ